jgi:hypothetical protein
MAELRTAKRFSTGQFLMFLAAFAVLMVSALHAIAGCYLHQWKPLLSGVLGVVAAVVVLVYLSKAATPYQYDPGKPTKWGL